MQIPTKREIAHIAARFRESDCAARLMRALAADASCRNHVTERSGVLGMTAFKLFASGGTYVRSGLTLTRTTRSSGSHA